MNHTVYVNDEIESFIEKWHNHINLSEIFQNAIQDKIQILEAKEGSPAEMQKKIERFKNEEINSYRKGIEDGKSQGEKWVNEASLNDLKIISSNLEKNASDILSIIKKYEDYMPLNIYDKESDYDFEHWTQGYLDGFRRGAEKSWKQIKPYLNKKTT